MKKNIDDSCNMCFELLEPKDRIQDKELDGTLGTFCKECVEFLKKERKFAEFAKGCGLSLFPNMDGGRYLDSVYGLSGSKKSENIDFVNQLWNALVKAKNADKELLVENW